MTCAYCDAETTELVCKPCTVRFTEIEDILTKVAGGEPIERYAAQMLAMLAQDAIAFTAAIAAPKPKKPGPVRTKPGPVAAANIAIEWARTYPKGTVFGSNDLYLKGTGKFPDELDSEYRNAYRDQLLKGGMTKVKIGQWVVSEDYPMNENEQVQEVVEVEPEPEEEWPIDDSIDEKPERERFWIADRPIWVPDQAKPIERQSRCDHAAEVIDALVRIAELGTRVIPPGFYHTPQAKANLKRLLDKYGFLVYEIERQKAGSHVSYQLYRQGLMKDLAPERGK